MPKELIIDRAVWLRGDRHSSALLRGSDGKRCCIGITLQQAGMTDEKLRDVQTAHTIKELVGLPESCKWMAKASILSFYRVNDDDEITGLAREAKLTEMFKGQGIEVRFVGESS